MPSISECRVPYLLSNLLLVTESLTLIAGNGSSPAAANWYSRSTPVVVSSVTPWTDSAILVHLVLSVSKRSRSSARNTFHSAESSSSAGGTTPAFSYCAPRSTSMVASPPSSRIMLAGSPGQVSICSAAHQYSSRRLALPGEHRHALGLLRRAVRADDDGGGGVVLGGEDVARRPAHLGAERDQRLDQHRGLHGHVQRAGDARALERPHLGVLAAQRHQARHLVLGQPDLLAAELGQGQVGHLVVDAVADICGQPSVM